MTDIVYVLAMQRSGSTAFERFLASHEGTVAIGEARNVWSMRRDRARMCSCHEPYEDCPFWTRVRATAFGPDGRPDPHILASVTRHVDRPKYVPMMHHTALRTRRFREALPLAHDVINRFYESIAHHAPGRLIVESTKVPWYAHLLSTIPSLRVAYVHLVRDSRAVAYSHVRAHGTSPAAAAMAWNLNFAFSLTLVPYVRRRIIRVRYEDFARDPSQVAERVQALLHRLGMPPFGTRHEDADPAWYHAAFGNPMRFEREFAVRADEEWRTAFSARSRLTVGALTAPFLAASALYGRS